MTNNKFNYCPDCGGQNVENRNNLHWVCTDCGLDLYNNIAGAVGVILQDNMGNVLFEIRQKEPCKGMLALPGGFVAPYESAEEALVRECKEELGASIYDIRYLCSFGNDYPYKNILYKTIDIFFIAKLKGNNADIREGLHAQDSEVAGFELHKCATKKDIESLPLAFGSSRKALEVLCSRK